MRVATPMSPLAIEERTDETALYVVLENHSAQRRAVVAISSDVAATAEMHEMRMDGKMMRMSPIAQIAIVANRKTELRPGGLHIMLFGLKTRPAIGDSVRVTLVLDDGSKIPVTAMVRK
jgi:copper(I)-binding protein